MQNSKETIYVIGHKNPDTDSICSAICYAELKKTITGDNYIPKRAGDINSETEFILNYFSVPTPEFINDVRVQVKDVEYRHMNGVSQEISIKKAWELLKNTKATTIPSTDNKGNLIGLITVGDIAMTYMDVYDNHIVARANTPYKNLIETLDGELVVGNINDSVSSGKVLIAAANPDLMENYIKKNDIVILGNRYESQLCAIEMDAQCIIICEGAPVSKTITKLAEDHNCTIIKSLYDTYTVARLINQSIPIRHFMKKDDLVTFSTEDYISNIKDVMANQRHQYYPVLDVNNKYMGLISRRNYLNARPKKIILVDHNELSQSLNGIDEVELLEIIDHHRLGGIQTMSPVFFRNQPLGCTATIIYQMYTEFNIEIPEKIAGLLASAIISDTLMFRSPTCTAFDKLACESLAKIAKIDIEDFATKMFKSGSILSNKTEYEIFHQDYKVFTSGETTFGIGQINSLNGEVLQKLKPKILKYMFSNLDSHKVDMLFFMLTDILEESTDLLFVGEDSNKLIEDAFRTSADNNCITLSNVVSRKKQLVPELVNFLKN